MSFSFILCETFYIQIHFLLLFGKYKFLIRKELSIKFFGITLTFKLEINIRQPHVIRCFLLIRVFLLYIHTLLLISWIRHPFCLAFWYLLPKLLDLLENLYLLRLVEQCQYICHHFLLKVTNIVQSSLKGCEEIRVYKVGANVFFH